MFCDSLADPSEIIVGIRSLGVLRGGTVSGNILGNRDLPVILVIGIADGMLDRVLPVGLPSGRTRLLPKTEVAIVPNTMAFA